jgi:hypothetical protein
MKSGQIKSWLVFAIFLYFIVETVIHLTGPIDRAMEYQEIKSELSKGGK